MPPKPIIMGIYFCLHYLPSHYLTTFKEAFLIGYFESQFNIFGAKAWELQTRYVVYQCQEHITPLPQVINDLDTRQCLKKYQDALYHICPPRPPRDHQETIEVYANKPPSQWGGMLGSYPKSTKSLGLVDVKSLVF